MERRAIKFAHCFRRANLCGRSDGGQAPRLHQRDAAVQIERLIRQMCRHQNAFSPFRKVANKAKHASLIAEIEARGRFVHDDDRRVLGERPDRPPG